MPDTQAIASDARPKRPRKKISSASSMPLFYDALNLKNHCSKSRDEDTSCDGERQAVDQATASVGDDLQSKTRQD